jgi:hypothetical protein
VAAATLFAAHLTKIEQQPAVLQVFKQVRACQLASFNGFGDPSFKDLWGNETGEKERVTIKQNIQTTNKPSAFRSERCDSDESGIQSLMDYERGRPTVARRVREVEAGGSCSLPKNVYPR